MKEIILCADGDSVVYSVPDDVADNLEPYCIEFCDNWLWNSPDAEKYRKGKGVCYTEADFIEYLNQYIFPDEKSELIINLGWIQSEDELPEKYKNVPRFFF